MTENYRFNQELGLQLHKVVYLMDRTADRAVRAGADVTLSQYLVILSLDKASGFSISQQAIADYLGIHKAAVSRHITLLERKGLVVRGDHLTSKREYNLQLTKAGRDTMIKARASMFRTMTPHFQAAGPELLERLRIFYASLERDATRSADE